MKTILETQRLVAREFLLLDAGNLLKLNSDPKVLQYTGDKAFVNEAQAQKTIEKRILRDQYEKDGFGRWAIHLKANGLFIGWAGLRKLEEMNEVDLGFRFHKRFWNKGYATEISKAIVQYGFEEHGLKSIIGRAMVENKASIRVLEKIGMQFETKQDCKEYPALIYRMIKSQKITE